MKKLVTALVALIVAVPSADAQYAPQIPVESGVVGNAGRMPGEFSGVHGLACPSEDLLFAAETSNSRVQKLILNP